MSAESPGPDLTVGDWLVFFVSKNRGVGRVDIVTLIRVSSQKAVGNFPPTLPLSQHFAPREKYPLILA